MKVTKGNVLKALAVIVLPGGIPVFLGYTAYKLYKKRKAEGESDERHKTEGDREHKI